MFPRKVYLGKFTCQRVLNTLTKRLIFDLLTYGLATGQIALDTLIWIGIDRKQVIEIQKKYSRNKIAFFEFSNPYHLVRFFLFSAKKH